MQNNQKLQLIQKKFIKYSIIYSVIIIIVGSVCLSVNFIKNSNFTANNELKNQIDRVHNSILEVNKKQTEATEALSLWNKVNQSYQKREGLAIDKSKIIIDNLSKIYHLSSKPDVDLSNPIELSDIYKTETTVIMSSEVNIKLVALTDEYILQFFDSIKKNFPGFITFKQFSINKKGEITPDILSKISSGQFPDIVSAQLIFEWRDFKDIIKLNDKDLKK